MGGSASVSVDCRRSKDVRCRVYDALHDFRLACETNGTATTSTTATTSWSIEVCDFLEQHARTKDLCDAHRLGGDGDGWKILSDVCGNCGVFSGADHSEAGRGDLLDASLSGIMDNLLLGEEEGSQFQEEGVTDLESSSRSSCSALDMQQFTSIPFLIANFPTWSVTPNDFSATPLQSALASGDCKLALSMLASLERVKDKVESAYVEHFKYLEPHPCLLAFFNNILPRNSSPHSFAKTGKLELLVAFGRYVKGYDWTTKDSFDSTPIYYACHCGFKLCKNEAEGARLVKWLLEAGNGNYDNATMERCMTNSISEKVKKVLRGGALSEEEEIAATSTEETFAAAAAAEGGEEEDADGSDFGLCNLFAEDDTEIVPDGEGVPTPI